MRLFDESNADLVVGSMNHVAIDGHIVFQLQFELTGQFRSVGGQQARAKFRQINDEAPHGGPLTTVNCMTQRQGANSLVPAAFTAFLL